MSGDSTRFPAARQASGKRASHVGVCPDGGSVLPLTDARGRPVHHEWHPMDGLATERVATCINHAARCCKERPMKTDMQLQKDVIDELKWQPRTRDAEIGVAAKGGVITLTGPVSSYVQKFEAPRIAARVNGVRSVADETQVKLPNSSVRNDADIAHSVVSAFRWNI